jgi:Flp pilus assembly protein TadG
MNDRIRALHLATLAKLERLMGLGEGLRGENGASLVEVSLILAILAPALLLGTVGAAGLVYASIEVSNAAHAGAAYAAEYYIANSNTALPTTTQVTTAVQNDAPELTALLKPGTTLTISMATGCNGGSATTGNSIPSCSTGVLPYVQVTTQATVVPFTAFAGLPHSLTMSSQATINLVN